MAAAAIRSESEERGKIVYIQDGVFVHTAVPKTTHNANIILGKVSILEKDNSTFVDWSPCGHPEEFELQSSAYSEWNLVTQSKPDDDEKQEKERKDTQNYAILFNTRDLHSIRRSDPKLAWSYVVFVLRDGTTLPALHFHMGGIQEMIRNLQRYIWLTRSPTNHRLYVVDEDCNALKKSLDQLQIFPDAHSSPPSYLPWQRLLNSAYYDGMDALSRVTKYVRDVYDVFQQPPDGSFQGCPMATKEKDTGFEDLGESTLPKVEKPLEVPNKHDLGEEPLVRRNEPLQPEEWSGMLDGAGRVVSVKRLHDGIFRGGVEHSLRKEVWKYLLGYYKYGGVAGSRASLCRAKEEEYRTMKWQWQSISAQQEKRFSALRDRKQLIEKDVTRTDRLHQFYAENNNTNVKKLNDILMTYCMYNFDLGYVQGMSDLLSPILYIMDDEVEAFWCFVGFMRKVAHNFDFDQESMKVQLRQVAVLLKFIDPGLFSYLEQHESGNLYFCFRWLLIYFKREFSFADIMILWEALWTQSLSPNFHLFICLAILDKHREVIIGQGLEFTEILKYINDLAYNIDVHETLIKAESICLQLLALPDLPEEVRSAVTGRNAAVLTPDVERTDPFIVARSRRVARLLSIDGECGSAQASHNNTTDDDILVISERDVTTTNDLSASDDTVRASDAGGGASVSETSLNVEDPSSDDEVVVLSEEVENVF